MWFVTILFVANTDANVAQGDRYIKPLLELWEKILVAFKK